MKLKILAAVLLLAFIVVVSGCTTGFAIFKPECPNACCLKDSDYKVKACADPTYSCIQNQCVKCGNSQKELGENCKTCPQDSPCGEGQACSNSGQCIQLGTDQNCARIGDACTEYRECKNSQCIQKSCIYECCDGSTYKLKTCGKYDTCAKNKCVNRVAKAAGDAGKEVTNTIRDVAKDVSKGLDTIKSLW